MQDHKHVYAYSRTTTTQMLYSAEQTPARYTLQYTYSMLLWLLLCMA
jgi:hypothetical protein